jgi:rubrerythrin
MSLKGTKTEKNLMTAFAGESQARNRYTFFASAAKKEGHEQIASIFLEAADNELAHAKLFFKLLEGGMVDINVPFPAGIIGTTEQNLKASSEGENEEWTKGYKEFGDTAEKEGFTAIAMLFRNIAKIEAEHEKRFRKLLANIDKGEVFKKGKTTTWECRNCGHRHEGVEAPNQCPTCQHPQSYFEVSKENY